MTDLRQFAKGGGCSLKISSFELDNLLAGLRGQTAYRHPLVGLAEQYDYGAVCVEGSTNALVQSVDLIAPVCANARLFGEIVVAHTLSDIFAAGAAPLSALAILVLPDPSPPLGATSEILEAISGSLRQENCYLLGGHTVRSGESLLVGLAVTGTTKSGELLGPGGAKDGDLLILTKPLGTGLYVAADRYSHPNLDFSLATESMRRTNRCILQLRQLGQINAAVDVSGYGLSDALQRIAVHSNLYITLTFADVPLFPQTRSLARLGFHTRLTDENNFATRMMVSTDALPLDELAILNDPQTSGGLLLAVPSADVERILSHCRKLKNNDAQVIGMCSSREQASRVVLA